MNIYSIYWEQSEAFGLAAVVVANSEEEALTVIDLDPDYNSAIRAKWIGIACGGFTEPCIVAKESP